jgi:hypothetical protein
MGFKGFKRGLILAPFFLISCSVTSVRPSQEMSDMEVSLKSAIEIQADLLAPELYRLASETALQARKEYRFKNFLLAKKHADQARVYAEKAEFEALRNGAKREAVPSDPLAEPSYPSEAMPSPTPIYGDAPATGPTTGKTPGPAPSPGAPSQPKSP